MTMDRSFVERNLASRERIRDLAARLSDDELQHRVGEHWTVAITLAHLAFWDRRALYVLDMTEREGKLFIPEIDIFVNDLSLPLWAAIPPRQAARLAVEAAEEVDRRLETFPPSLLEQIYTYNQRWVVRALHRGEHLDEADAALDGLTPLKEGLAPGRALPVERLLRRTMGRFAAARLALHFQPRPHRIPSGQGRRDTALVRR